MKFYKDFPITLEDPDTDETIEAFASFYYHPELAGTHRCPPEEPYIDITEVVLMGANVLDFLSLAQIEGIECDLFEAILNGEECE